MRLLQIASFLALIIAGPLLLVLPLAAQSPNGTINGMVEDPAHRAIVDADIVVVNDVTRVQYRSKTNEEGIYMVPNLPPGPYRLQVSKVGFKTLIKPDIILTVQDALSINFTLPIGAFSETVTVEGGAPLINTESSAVSTVIDRQFSEALPLNGRSFNTLVLLVPGAVGTPSAAGEPGQFSFNGQRSDANDFQVDGASVNFGVSLPGGYQNGGGGTQAFNAYGGTSSLVSVDAMQEFRVQTSSFAPEFGRTPGGQVSIVTRAGTNDFHGTLFDYLRNTVFDANDWFASAAGVPRTRENQNDFGGVLGGPILRDKTFFFVSYEGLRLHQPQTLVSSVPSDSLRAAATSPAAAALLNAYPLANGPVLPTCPLGVCAQLTSSFPTATSLDAASLRLDHTLNSHWTLFARYNFAPSNIDTDVNVPNVVRSTNNRTQTLTFNVATLFSASSSNTFRFNYSVQNLDGLYRLISSDGAQSPDAALLFPSPLEQSVSLAYIDPGPFSALNVGSQGANRETQLSFSDDFEVGRGGHIWKSGVDIRRLVLRTRPVSSALEYLSSAPVSFGQTGNVTMVGIRRAGADISLPFLSFYSQDRWRLGQHLMATYGLRWDINPAPSAGENTTLTAWRNTDRPALLALAPRGESLWKTKFTHFAPRVGFTYSPGTEGRWVMRGGFGIFYDLGTGIASQLAFAFPNSNLLVSNGTLPIPDAATFLPSLPSLVPPYQSSIVNGFSNNLSAPRSYQWNAAVEKAITASQALAATYVGQLGRDLLRSEYLPRPNPDFAPSSYFYYEYNGDSSSYNALQLQYRVRNTGQFQALANYTWSHSIDTGSSDYSPNTSATIIDPSTGRGSSSFDVRHTFSGALHYGPTNFRAGRWATRFIDGWSWDTVVVARTAFPVTVLTYSVAIPGNIVPVRPNVVPGEPFYIADSTAPGGRVLNSAAFSTQTQPAQGTLPRDAIRGFGMWQANFSLARNFPLTSRVTLQFRADAFNAFNHPNFGDPFNYFGFGNFGRATQMLNNSLSGLSPLYQVGGPRSLQLMFRLSF